MRRLAPVLFATLLLSSLSLPSVARAESGQCREGALAVTGDRTDQVLANCGRPTWARVYPGTGGRYRRLPVEVWEYDLGTGYFPVILRFVNGILEEVTIVSRERF